MQVGRLWARAVVSLRVAKSQDTLLLTGRKLVCIELPNRLEFPFIVLLSSGTVAPHVRGPGEE